MKATETLRVTEELAKCLDAIGTDYARDKELFEVALRSAQVKALLLISGSLEIIMNKLTEEGVKKNDFAG